MKFSNNQETFSYKNRYYGIDIIKTISITFVISVHFFLNTNFYKTNLNNPNLFFQTFLQQIFLTCIPLFIMSTGFLNNHTNINKNYFKKIIPIILIYILYSIPAIIYRYFINEIPFEPILWLKLLFTFKGHRYSWYINLYFGLFLLIPFLNKMYYSLSSKKEKQLLIAIFILLTNLTTLNIIPNYWKSIYPLTYFFIGKYINEFEPKLHFINNIIYLIVIILFQTIVEFLFANGLRYKHILTDYSSIFRLIEAYLIFILFYNKSIKHSFFNKCIVNISKLTLDIYLASFLTDRIIYKAFKLYIIKHNNLSQDIYILFIIPLVLSSFIFAFIIALLRNRYVKIK